MNQLIMTLGKGSRVDGGRYRTATYEFSDGHVAQPSPFFGLRLLNWLQLQAKRKPSAKIDRVIILGTSHSMWDALLEIPELDAGGEAITAMYDTLFESVDSEAGVDADSITALNIPLSSALGTDVFCHLIPYGRDQEEQSAILAAMADLTPERTTVHMDVTHGFRHLPMLQMLSAFHLVETRHCTVGGFYYGALDMTPRMPGAHTPVVELPIAVEMMRWQRACAALNLSGNIRPLANLTEMKELQGDMKNARFLEECNQVARSTSTTKKVRQSLAAMPLPVAGELFRVAIDQSFEWADGPSYALRQFKAAKKAFDTMNYLRAVTLLHEALITTAIDPQANEHPENFHHRDRARGRLDKTENGNLLACLRNAMAHGTSPNIQGSIGIRLRKMLTGEEDFRSGMKCLFDDVLKTIDNGA